MAQNITLLGASYTDVPAVELPKTGGGTASFTDVTPTTAVATDVLDGKYFFTAQGVLTLGTNQGGSGDGYVWQDQDGYVHLSDEQGTQTIIDTLNVNASGTYTAPTGHAYSPVVVPSGTAGTPSATKGTVSNHSVSVTPSVTNSAGFISGGSKTGTAVSVSASELVSGTKSITENGTGIDVTNYASVDVSVSGGGSSNVTLIASTELVVSTSSTSQTGLGNITGTANARTANAIVYVRVRDKAGKRQGYFYGSDTFFLEAYVANGITNAENRGVKTILTYNSSGQFVPYLTTGTSGYGVFPNSIYSQGNIAMYARYDATYSGTIDGTYAVDVFLIETPDNIPPFAYGEE